MSEIQAIVMPKWGLAMEEGTLVKWLVEEGEGIENGQEIMDIETSKIANVFESPVAGKLRRKVAGEGDLLPVGALLGVVAGAGAGDSDIEGFITAFQENFKTAAREKDTGPQPEFTEIDGRRIRYLKLGESGKPVLLVHGFGSDHTSWLFNHTALAETNQVYALDLPGHGASIKDVGDGRIETLAEVVAGFIRALDLDDVHLVGHSLGAAVSAAAASAIPERVSGLTLIAPVGFSTEISAPFLDGFLNEVRTKKLRPVLEMLVSDPGLVTTDMAEDVLKAKRVDGALEALGAIRTANFPGGSQRLSLSDQVGGFAFPVQIIRGAEDQVIAGFDRSALPDNVKVTEIAHSGHIPHMEKANDVNSLLRSLG